VSDGRWIASLCLARVGFALIFVAYSAALGLLKQDWGLSSAQAGLIQSAWHVGYLVSLFAIGFLADRYGAELVREPVEERLSAARRKAMMLCFARAAALRLQLHLDPSCGFEV